MGFVDNRKRKERNFYEIQEITDYVKSCSGTG